MRKRELPNEHQSVLESEVRDRKRAKYNGVGKREVM